MVVLSIVIMKVKNDGKVFPIRLMHMAEHLIFLQGIKYYV